MSEYLVKYEKILEDYRNGIYSNESLSVQTILRMYDADNLLEKLTKEDLEYLLDKTSDIKLKQLYGKLLEKKINMAKRNTR